VQYAANYSWSESATFEANNKIMKRAGNYAGTDFFNMFSYPLLEGDASGALQTPSGIAISKKMAEDFFGSPAAAMGKTIRYQDKADFKVTAVFDNIPQNSTKQFDYIINWQTFLASFVGIHAESQAREWTNSGPSCYIMLRDGTDATAFEKRIERFLDHYNKEQTPSDYIRLGIQRYGDIYLNSGFDENGHISGGRIQYVKLFSIVAIFILLIACINFMNLTTARSMKRAKEISVRKVVGAMRSSLARQFIGEALLVAFLAAILAVSTIFLALPHFNQITGKNITMPLNNVSFWISVVSLLFITGFIAGSYPAWFLSAFNPVRVLKGTFKIGTNALWLRKGLVIFQFVLSIVLIIGTIVVSRQVNYIRSVHLGYNRENLIYIPLEGDLPAKFELFKTQSSTMPGIKDITSMSNNLTQMVNKTSAVAWDGKDPNSGVEFAWSMVGYDFAETLNTQMIQGRDFSKNFAMDADGYVLNEMAARMTGYKDPVGKPFTFRQKRGTIIGVVKDFHFNSLHEKIYPLVLGFEENMKWGRALVRAEAGKTNEALASLEKICKELNPKIPFTFQFADEEYAKLYRSEQVVGQLANYFAFLAIFISCLGLLGLVTFTAERRKKELGIRKILGASPVTLFNLLSKEFLQLVLVALVIASPLAWLAMDRWLQNYAYKVTISWWMFVVAGIAAITIALVTISLQAIKTAVTNPVKSLRTE
jgi:ABC-type antimicrobial peptide transport system permease subunit